VVKIFIIELILSSIISAAAWYGDLLDYAVRMGWGQLKIITQTKSTEKWLKNPEVSDSVKYKILLVDEIRRFCFDSLGLKPTKSYTRIYDQGGKPLLWVVTASERYALKPKLWKFPLVGAVSYKGFFDEDWALKELNELKQAGYDARIREVNAWSTLGYFNDPILSEMLNKKEGELANVIIHELSHGTIFIEGDVEESENLASFIGDVGAEKFLRTRFGANSPQLTEYINDENDYKKLTTHMIGGAKILDSLYSAQGFIQNDEAKKLEMKKQTIKSIIEKIDTITFSIPARYPKLRNNKETHDNSLFIEYRQYYNKQDKYFSEYSAYGSNLRNYIAVLRQKFER
jgi:predicted aminopeptidase